MALTRGRKSYRDTLLDAQKANDHYALLADKPKLDYGGMIPDAPKKRAPKQPSAEPAEPLESAILKTIIAYLKRHPKVWWACRINSGVMESDYNGRKSFTRFNSQVGMSDILGMMRGGQFYAIECKRPPWAGPRNGREQDQDRFLANTRAGGGRAGFATCIEDVQRILGI